MSLKNAPFLSLILALRFLLYAKKGPLQVYEQGVLMLERDGRTRHRTGDGHAATMTLYWLLCEVVCSWRRLAASRWCGCVSQTTVHDGPV